MRPYNDKHYAELVEALRGEDNCNVLDYIDDAAAAIEELLQTCARLNEYRENANTACGKWEARAKMLEAQFDDAMDRIKNIASGDVYLCEVCKHRWKCALFKPQRKCDYFEYGIKGE